MDHYLHLGDIQVLDGEDDRLVTVLGSCIAVCLWSASERRGGMTHAFLPERPSARAASARYVRSSTWQLLDAFERRGSALSAVVARLYGGASMGPTAMGRSIGERNVAVAQEVLRQAAIPIVASDVGGQRGRRIRLDLGSGEVVVQHLEGSGET